MPRPRKIALDEQSGEEDRFTPHLVPDLLNKASPLSGQVYALIREAIIQLTLPPGAAISEKLLSERLGVSRTPLREAILQLSAENLVTVVPDMGTRVAPIQVQDVFDGQIIREAIELEVVRLAARRMSTEVERRLDVNMARQADLAGVDLDYDKFYELDEDFHRAICECGASTKVWRVINSAKAQLDRVRRLVFPVNNHLDVVLAEHREILNGLRSRDEEAAAAAMKVHLSRVFDSVKLLISIHPQYFSVDSMEELSMYRIADRD